MEILITNSMKHRIIQTVLLLGVQIILGSPPDSFTIAFGSCNKSTLPQPLWPVILKDKPDLWIWGGDNVYADTDDPKELREAYKRQNQIPEYRSFKDQVHIIGIWDDHDFGRNSTGGWHPAKAESQKAFLDFLQEPKESARRKTPGIYASYVYGDSGRSIKILLLDTRYFMEKQDKDAKLLGESQWAWLENQLDTTTANIHLLVSSIQILSPKTKGEQWANYPLEKQRLLSLLKKRQLPNLILISGDKHFAQIYETGIKKEGFKSIESTSSGMTHNRNFFLRTFDYLYRMFEPDILFKFNYGLLNIDWKSRVIDLQIKTVDGQTWKKIRIPIQ